MINFATLQEEHHEWAGRQFPNNTPAICALGVAEETGELCHAVLKMNQGIRGSKEKHEAAAKDAVGDIVIYLADFCNRSGFSLEECVETVWNEVKQRDWIANPETGEVE